ncbi:Di-copper centre-containing protein [Neolentinus lepideus HHB14362 ss-1]|uniref:tyrosinase n=1 Tax=Neolentinus lepideus HHB14362 ss-1 TaxID=1314782 RepID=A0A165TU36_9AGAM|nr:Di-copper centre-containing protein [Neolentinus lepideus HHB14362 ss-1]
MQHPKPYLIVGRKNTGGAWDRLPIESLQSKEPEQFTLFILGYLAIQDRHDSFGHLTALGGALPIDPGKVIRPATFLQIGGIHGLPYEEYAGDQRPPKETVSDFNPKDKKDTNPVPSRFGGYCNHGAVVFPTWHRPYMLLIEQAIGHAAEHIAFALEKHNPAEKGKWTDAAKKLRFPYWDWAESKIATDGLPPVLYTNKIEITLPGNTKVEVDNPIAYYPFKAIPQGFTNEASPTGTAGVTAYFADWKRTYRHAKSSPNPGDSNIPDLQKQLKSQAADLRSKVAHLFAFGNALDSSKAWDEFSNHTTESLREEDFVNSGSLEGVHDSVHLILGGNGHMADPDYAGFDPIFFLHHSNVDRLLALWEYCYREYWMNDGYTTKGTSYPWTQARGTYFEVYNEQLLPDSAMAPFRNGEDKYWTSTQARFLDKDAYPKYYSYDEVAGVKVDQPASTADRIKARSALQKYYGLNPRQTAQQLTATNPPLFKAQTQPVPAHHTVISNYRHFVVLARLPEHAFNRSYSFQLYQKGIGSQGKELIGTVSVFARPDHSPCKGCALRREAGSVVRGTIAVPALLIDAIIKNKEGLNHSHVTDDTLADGIKSDFVGVLVDWRGVELAEAQGGASVSSVPEGDSVPVHVAPVQVVLLSAAAAHPHDDEDGPVSLFDWKNHGEIFSAGWKKTDNYSV